MLFTADSSTRMCYSLWIAVYYNYELSAAESMNVLSTADDIVLYVLSTADSIVLYVLLLLIALSIMCYLLLIALYKCIICC